MTDYQKLPSFKTFTIYITLLLVIWNTEQHNITLYETKKTTNYPKCKK